MNFKDFGKYNQFKEQFANMPPELKEQMMKMAKERMQAKVREFFKKWFSLPALTGIAILLGAFVGALMALFGRVLLAAGDLRSTYPLYFIPALALVGAGIVFAYRKWGKDSSRGMSLVFAVGQGKESKIPLQLIPLVMIGTWATHLFGGSAGREGVAVQIGGTVGNFISRKLPIEGASHILLVAGMAAGFSGLFQIPFAATAFALEVLVIGYLDFKSLLPTAAAAFTACKVSNLLGLEKFSVDLNELLQTHFGTSVNAMLFHDGLDISLILKIAGLGILFGIVGGCFAKVLQLSKDFFAKKFPDSMCRILMMGIVLSALFLLLWQGRYSGLGTNLIDIAFAENGVASGIQNYDWILKFLLTILTLSAGFLGGEVTPLFSIGSTFGVVAAAAFGIPIPLAASLGYAAVFGSATKTLLAPILIGCEVFGFDALPAFFIACVMARVCNGGQSVYNQRKIILN